MTAGQLRTMLQEIPDDARVVLEVTRYDGDISEAPIEAATLDASVSSSPRLFLHGIGSVSARALTCSACADRESAR